MDRSSTGYSLVELVVTIVLIALLSAVAVPKFISLSQDSKASALAGVASAMRSGLQMIYAKSSAVDQDGVSGTIVIDGVDIPLHNGYPAVDGDDGFEEINQQVKAWLDIDSVPRDEAILNPTNATFFTDKSSASNWIFIFFTEDRAVKSTRFLCYVLYTNSGDEGPTVTIYSSDC
ncbi:pilus assembly FimT family protein [Ferrimonas lipolytica]|uniref:Prepilin-type N-terminal cleavage/methylation domain-containing protein n=1 Tax=Ferrimonas lipolytica TaxID=2724191 RepID=A0A6H1UGJ1_9GAMM|nr:prepilin-type N-terminal cleavage/methylation domain-containing protein [Ferrimonas lipolytica]QIZ77720.1 prepilin-type N-terminal cleavage/methylation domain-containing protein [Ferrimonas lipolytica]